MYISCTHTHTLFRIYMHAYLTEYLYLYFQVISLEADKQEAHILVQQFRAEAQAAQNKYNALKPLSHKP